MVANGNHGAPHITNELEHLERMRHAEWERTKRLLDEQSFLALRTYSLGMDKWLSSIAGARLFGLDPREVPPFGWNMLGTPRGGDVHVKVNSPEELSPAPSKPSRPAPRTNSPWPWVAAAIVCMAIIAACAIFFLNPATRYTGVIVQEQKQANGEWAELWRLRARPLSGGLMETEDGRRWHMDPKTGYWTTD